MGTLQVQGLKETMEDDSDDEEDSQLSGQSPAETSTSQSTLLFGSNPLRQRELRLLHPPPAQLPALLYFFQKNVDPMAKVLHIPSLRKLVMGAAGNIDAIPSGNYVEALLFAMYYAAITSLTQEECLQNFHDGRGSLLARYRSGTESALSNADLLSTKEIGTVQALAIFLVSVFGCPNDLIFFVHFVKIVERRNQTHNWTILTKLLRPPFGQMTIRCLVGPFSVLPFG